MPDTRFFQTLPPLPMEEAIRLSGGVRRDRADDACSYLTGAADPASNDLKSQIVFVDDAVEARKIRGRTVGLTLTSRSLADEVAPDGVVCLVSSCRLAFSAVASALHQEFELSPGDPAVHPHANIDPSARVHPFAIIGAGALIGAGAVILPGAIIGPGVEIGANSRIGAGATVFHALIGECVVIGPGARIGEAGFGFVEGPGGLIRTPQLGRVIIGPRSEIGANTAIDRGALRDTVIGEGVKIDNLVQIGHNVSIGKHCIIAAQTGIAGSCEIGDGVMLGGQVGVADHLKIGAGARIAAGSGVMKDIGPGEKWGGLPARPFATWMREVAALGQLAQRRRGARGNGEESGNGS